MLKKIFSNLLEFSQCPATNFLKEREIISASCHRLHRQRFAPQNSNSNSTQLHNFLRGVSNVTAWHEVGAIDIDILCTPALSSRHYKTYIYLCAGCTALRRQSKFKWNNVRGMLAERMMMTRQLNIFSFNLHLLGVASCPRTLPLSCFT